MTVHVIGDREQPMVQACLGVLSDEAVEVVDDPAAATVSIAETLAKHGYIVMVQDTRGRHHSQGDVRGDVPRSGRALLVLAGHPVVGDVDAGRLSHPDVLRRRVWYHAGVYG